VTIVTIASGPLRGQIEGGCVVFRGVPYATAGRFEPPASVPGWTTPRDANQNGPIAPQAPSRLRAAMGDFSAPRDEDCLTLTIWAPAAEAGPRPVFVWLHGGAWSSGAGSLPWYDGGRLAAEQGIVVVGVNYRLGPLGYLCAPEISLGNLGSMDQVAALEWVRDNIAGFGGDPGCVTVGGQSAGAATIGRLIIDPAARALFHRAILQSGGFGRPPLSRAEATGIGEDYVRLLGIDPASPAAAAAVRALPAGQLIEAAGRLARARAHFADTTPPFMPLVEAAITAAALVEQIADGAADLDVMIGTTREEVHAFYAADLAMADPPAEAVTALFQSRGADVFERYRARRPDGSTMDWLADLASDENFTLPSLRLADAMAAHGARVFAYRFDWSPPGSRFKACHCIDLPFTFGTLDAWADAPMLAGGDPAQMAALSNIMRSNWGHFIREGHPEDGWPRFSKDAQRILRFGALRDGEVVLAAPGAAH
jgi:para-nitrobenzyl esterase